MGAISGAHRSNRLFRSAVEPAGVCVWVCAVGEGAWLHPSDWRRLLPCLKSPTGRPYDWEREVGRFSLIRPGKRKRKKKDTSSLPRPSSKPITSLELSSSPAFIFYFGDSGWWWRTFLSISLLNSCFLSKEGALSRVWPLFTQGLEVSRLLEGLYFFL